MKNIILCVVMLVISGCASLQTPQETNIAVSEILKQLQFTIDEIAKKPKDSSLPPLKEAEIKLTTTVGTKDVTKGSLIISGEYEKNSTDSNILTLVLVPNTRQSLDKDNAQDYSVAEHILAAVEAIDKNNTTLELKSLTYEAGLKIETVKGAGLKIELIGIETESGRTNTVTNANSLKLVFEKKAKPEKSAGTKSEDKK